MKGLKRKRIIDLMGLVKRILWGVGLGLATGTATWAQCSGKNVADQTVNFRLTYDKSSQRITAWYVPSVSSTHRLVTGQFSILTANGFTDPEAGSGRDSKLEITNINGSWQDEVVDNELIMRKGFSPLAMAEGMAIHQVGMAPQAVEIGEVTAGTPVALFSFPATGQEGVVRIVTTGEKVQQELLKKFGINISNELSIQSPAKAFVRAEQRYCKNDVQNQIEFKRAQKVDHGLAVATKPDVHAIGVTENGGFSAEDALSVVPNPAKTEIVLSYHLLAADNVGIDLLDAQGRIIQTLIKRQHHAIGKYQSKVQLQELAAGTYFCSMRGESVQKTVKLLVVQ